MEAADEAPQVGPQPRGVAAEIARLTRSNSLPTEGNPPSDAPHTRQEWTVPDEEYGYKFHQYPSSQFGELVARKFAVFCPRKSLRGILLVSKPLANLRRSVLRVNRIGSDIRTWGYWQ